MNKVKTNKKPQMIDWKDICEICNKNGTKVFDIIKNDPKNQ